MSAEELRAAIEATRRRAEAEEARLPQLEAETEQARERQRLREELGDMVEREQDAWQRNDIEIAYRRRIDDDEVRAWQGPPKKQPATQASGGRSFDFGDSVAKGDYLWRIEGFSWVPCALLQSGGHCVTSSFGLAEQNVFLLYNPHASYLCEQYHGSLAILVITDERIALRYRIYVKAQNGEFVQWGETCDVVHRGGFNDDGWTCPRTAAYGPDVHWPGHAPSSLGIFGLSHKELLQSEWVENDTLTVKFELEVRPDKDAKMHPLSLAAQVPEPTMSEDTWELLEKGTCSDVRFMVQGEVIQAHSQILCARSEVFSKQLTAGMQESISKVIVIEDCDVTTFNAFLRFVYTDRLPHVRELLSNGTSSEPGNESGGLQLPHLPQIQALLAVSHKYQVKRLQLWCEAKLSEQIDTPQVCGILCQAHLFQAKQLEQACLRFIKDHADQVFTLPAYLELIKKWPQVALKISLFSAGVHEEEQWEGG